MNTATDSVRKPNPALIFEHFNAYQRSAALKTAIELDLFTEIARGNRSASALATAVQASPRGIRMLCDFLAVIGILEKEGEHYALTPDSSTFLDRNSPACFGSVSAFLLDTNFIAPFLNLTEIVRTGHTTLPGDGTVSPDNPIWVEFAKEMAPMMLPAADEIAELVAGDGDMRVLDIAAGHGLFGIMIAKRNPHAHITALDWPNVLAVAKQNAQKFGVLDRLSILSGDAFETDFHGPYEMVLVTNFFHHFDPSTCETLMRKIHAALAPGGCCATFDFVPNDDRVSPPAAAAFGMVMLGTTRAGDVYTFAEYQAMFQSAGFQSSHLHPMQRTAESLILSRA